MSASNSKQRFFQVEKPISIGTYDIDFAGHVSNLVYLRWMEDLRLEVFEQHFPLKGFMDDGLLPILTSTKIDYKRAVTLFDKPVGIMGISEIKRACVIFDGEIRIGDKIATKASHVGTFIRQETGKPVRVPKIIMEKFELEKSPLVSS